MESKDPDDISDIFADVLKGAIKKSSEREEWIKKIQNNALAGKYKNIQDVLKDIGSWRDMTKDEFNKIKSKLRLRKNLSGESLNFVKEDFHSFPLNESLLSAIKKKYKVVKTPKTVDDFSDFYNTVGSVYTDDGKWEISSSYGAIYITDLKNALSTGKNVETYVITTHDRGGSYPVSVINGLRDVKFEDLLKAISKGKAAVQALYSDGNLAEDLQSVRKESNTKGQNYFSPFAVTKLKRVEKLPSRPNRTHLIKLVANGQFSMLTNDFQISRDGDYPDRMNPINVDPIGLLEDLVTWRDVRLHIRVSEKGETIMSFGPHSNSSYTLVVDLSKKLRITL